MQKQTIFNKTPVQQNFLGLNAVYHGYAGLSDDAGRVYTPQQCDLEADRAAALGLKVARTYYKWYAYDFEKTVGIGIARILRPFAAGLPGCRRGELMLP